MGRRRRSARRCTRAVAKGSFTKSERGGTIKLGFTGRLRSGALKPGSYALTLTPTDLARNRGKAKTVKFTIVRA